VGKIRAKLVPWWPGDFMGSTTSSSVQLSFSGVRMLGTDVRFTC
jgi:hypothetical protein